MKLVVDAAVGLKWVIAEAASAEAAELRRHHLVAPDLILVEWAVALRQKVDRAELDEREALDRLELLCEAPLELLATSQLLFGAWQLAVRVGSGLTAAFYLAAAERGEGALVTTDRSLVAATRSALGQSFPILLLGEDLEAVPLEHTTP